MKFKYLLCLLLILPFSISLLSQELIPFKDRMSTEKYKEFSEAETKANEEQSPFERSVKYRDLAAQSTRLVSDDLGIIFYKKAMSAAIESKSDSMIAVITVAGSIPLMNTAKYDEAGQRLYKALLYWEQSNDTIQLANCHSQIGRLEGLKGSNYLAIKHMHTAKKLKETRIPLSEMWAITNSLISKYNQLKDYESAIGIGEEYLESTRDLENKPRGYYTILRNTGEMRLKNGDIEIAKRYIDEALPKWMQNRIPKFMISSYSLLHDVALQEGDLNLAKIYADSSLYYSIQYDSPMDLSDAHLRVYKVLREQGQKEKQKYHISRALDFAMVSEHKTTMLRASKATSQFSADNKDYMDAYQSLYLADSIRTILYSDETINNIKRFEKQLIQEEGQEEIELLNLKNELTQNKLTAARRRNYALCTGFLILTGLGWWIYSLYQRTQKQNGIISKALNEKETLLKEIHHRVKNNLQFISSLLHLQTRHVSDVAALDVLQEGQDRVQSMALIHQNLYQEDNLTGVDMKAYFEKMIKGLFDSYNIHNDRIQLELDIINIQLDVDTVIPLGLIVNELISNSLKYAFPEERPGVIKVSLDRIEETLLLAVEDNGVGMSDAGKERMATSFGYKLINAFSRQLEAEMTVDSADGTNVRFAISSFEVAV